MTEGSRSPSHHDKGRSQSQNAPSSGVQLRAAELRGRERAQLHSGHVRDLVRERNEADVVLEKSTVVRIHECVFVGIHRTRIELVLIRNAKGGAWREQRSVKRESGKRGPSAAEHGEYVRIFDIPPEKSRQWPAVSATRGVILVDAHCDVPPCAPVINVSPTYGHAPGCATSP